MSICSRIPGLVVAAAWWVSALPMTAAEDPVRLRVLSYNIHHAEGTDGVLDLKRIASVIRQANADLVALQEVDRGVQRSDRVDQPRELARLTGMQVAFGPNLKYQGGDYGNAVLSRLPLHSHRNHPLPVYDKGEQRGVLEVIVEGPEDLGPLLFLATHLDHRRDDSERRSSVARIEEIAREHPHLPALLAGDLNDEPDSEVLRRFGHSWEVARSEVPTPTVPAASPRRQIDYVLVRPLDRWKTIEVRVLDEPVASDHRPILVILEPLPQ